MAWTRSNCWIVPAREARAVDTLFERHRGRLKQMIAVHLDPRIASRVDPSDIVQETLIDATRRLPDYLEKRPITFYPWLREIARRKLIDVLRRHLSNEKRTGLKETELVLQMPDDSVAQLVDQLIDGGTDPSRLVSPGATKACARSRDSCRQRTGICC